MHFNAQVPPNPSRTGFCHCLKLGKKIQCKWLQVTLEVGGVTPRPGQKRERAVWNKGSCRDTEKSRVFFSIFCQTGSGLTVLSV
jgi:hypothetical protein